MIETIDLPERIREVAFAHLLASGETVSTEMIATDLGTSAASVEAATDAFGAAGWVDAARGVDAPATTACVVCGTTLTVPIHTGAPEGGPMLWMSAGGEDLRADFWTPTVLLCSEDYGRDWGRRQAGNGQLLDLNAAAEAGQQRWAGCAQGARRLGQAE